MPTSQNRRYCCLCCCWCLTWSPNVFCKLPVLPTSRTSGSEPESQNIATSCWASSPVSSAMLPDTKCGGTHQDYCFAECLGAEICHVLLALDSALSIFWLRLRLVPMRYAPSMCFNRFHVSEECVLLPLRRWPALASSPIRDNTATTLSPFDSDTHHAATHISASALLHVLICCLRVHAFNV